MNEVWHARNGIVRWGRAWSSPVPAARIWPRGRGSGWKRCLTRARRGGGSIRWPAWSRSPSAVHRGRERPVHRGRAVDQAGPPGGPGPLRAPWDPIAGRYRAPDEKTIRVVLDCLDSRALARALLSGRPDSRRGGGPSPASVRGPSTWPPSAPPSSPPSKTPATCTSRRPPRPYHPRRDSPPRRLRLGPDLGHILALISAMAR